MKKDKTTIKEITELTPAVRAELLYTKWCEVKELMGESHGTLMLHNFNGIAQLDNKIWNISMLNVGGTFHITADREGITLFSEGTIS